MHPWDAFGVLRVCQAPVLLSESQAEIQHPLSHVLLICSKSFRLASAERFRRNARSAIGCDVVALVFRHQLHLKFDNVASSCLCLLTTNCLFSTAIVCLKSAHRVCYTKSRAK